MKSVDGDGMDMMGVRDPRSKRCVTLFKPVCKWYACVNCAELIVRWWINYIVRCMTFGLSLVPMLGDCVALLLL